LNQRKGIDLLLRALAHLIRNGQDVVLDIGGEGPEREALVLLARDLGIADRVNFLGLLSREGVRKAMQEAHLFVLPSSYETFGVAYIEAMACGLPVIATRCGGPEGFVTPDVGYLVPQSDENALATTIHDVFVNYHRFDGNEIRCYVVRRFGSDAVAKKLITIYERVVSRRAMGC
jgi:glycosyltransferase involved in cell wall biosynthesis